MLGLVLSCQCALMAPVTCLLLGFLMLLPVTPCGRCPGVACLPLSTPVLPCEAQHALCCAQLRWSAMGH